MAFPKTDSSTFGTFRDVKGLFKPRKRERKTAGERGEGGVSVLASPFLLTLILTPLSALGAGEKGKNGRSHSLRAADAVRLLLGAGGLDLAFDGAVGMMPDMGPGGIVAEWEAAAPDETWQPSVAPLRGATWRGP